MSANNNENRAYRRAANDPDYGAHAPSLERRSFSLAENKRVEVCVADPDYTRTKALADTAPISDQAAPNSTPPAGDEVWNLKGYMGGHGYVVLDQAETVDIELWTRDQDNDAWFLVDSISSVSSYEEFRFADKIRNRKIWLRLTNIGANITSIALRFSPE